MIASTDRPAVFGIRTRLSRAAGKGSSRYASNAVRAVPGPKKDQIVLEATDGCQATCLITQGEMSEAHLVPSSVLPTRQLSANAVIEKVNGVWRSSEGKLAPDEFGAGEGSFPPIADVLPQVHKRPFYITSKQAERCGPGGHPHVVVALDVDLLRKITEAMGASKVTLLIPVPVRRQGARRDDAHVNRPIAVCPTTTEQSGHDGVAAVMPITPANTTRYYEQMRRTVVEAERRNAPPAIKNRSHACPAPTPTNSPAESASSTPK